MLPVGLCCSVSMFVLVSAFPFSVWMTQIPMHGQFQCVICQSTTGPTNHPPFASTVPRFLEISRCPCCRRLEKQLKEKREELGKLAEQELHEAQTYNVNPGLINIGLIIRGVLLQ